MPEQPDLPRSPGSFGSPGLTGTAYPPVPAPSPPAAAPVSPPLADRLRNTPGLRALVAEAEQTWRSRGAAAGDDPAGPAWRAFEDAFPTFYEFTNRPR